MAVKHTVAYRTLRPFRHKELLVRTIFVSFFLSWLYCVGGINICTLRCDVRKDRNIWSGLLELPIFSSCCNYYSVFLTSWVDTS